MRKLSSVEFIWLFFSQPTKNFNIDSTVFLVHIITFMPKSENSEQIVEKLRKQVEFTDTTRQIRQSEKPMKTTPTVSAFKLSIVHHSAFE